MPQIGGPRRKKKTESLWIADAQEEFENAFNLPPEMLFSPELDSEGNVLTGRTRVFDKTLINVGKKASGKCILPESWIFTKSGMKQIGTLYETKLQESAIESINTIETFNFTEFFPADTVAIYQKKNEPVIKIKNNLGIELGGTPEHRIVVLTKSGNLRWKSLKNIKIDDIIPIRKGSMMFPKALKLPNFSPVYSLNRKKKSIISPKTMTIEIGYLLGLLTGDGSLRTGPSAVRFTNNNKIMVELYTKTMQGEYGLKSSIYTNKTLKNDVQTFSTALKQHLVFLGLSEKLSHEKEVPWTILQSPLEVQASFLQGYFDTDGSVSKKGNGNYEVTYSSSSEKLTDQVQLMLLNFGIVSSKRMKTTSKNDHFPLAILSASFDMFIEHIGSQHPKKKQRLKQLKNIKRDTNLNTIPNIKTKLHTLWKLMPQKTRVDAGLTHKKQGSLNGIKYGIIPYWVMAWSKTNIPENKLSQFLDMLEMMHPSIVNHQHFKDLEIMTQGFFFSKVISCKKDMSDVYDFEVPDTHAYTANGIINHNSESINSWIQNRIDFYGEENVGINVGYDLFAILGDWDEQQGTFVGGVIGEEYIQIIIIEDALTLIGKDVSKDLKNKMTKVFQNARHLLKYSDENDNSIGLVIFVFNVQDYYLLHDSMRRDWDFVILKTIPKNAYHSNRLKREMPAQGIKILNFVTDSMRMNIMDQSYKSNSVVDFGSGRYGALKYDRVATNYTQKNGKYWVAPGASTSGTSITSSELRKTITSKYEFLKIKEESFPMQLLEQVMMYGRDNPFPSGARSKYQADKHWQIAYDYLVKGAATGMIAEDLGVSDQMIGNGYAQGGYIAIVVVEQMGYWIEPFLPAYDPSIGWKVIAGQGKSDLKDDEAIQAGIPGIGLHGEIKARRRKETPADSWVSSEMAEHIVAGGKAFLYQVVIRRNRMQQPDPMVMTYTVTSAGGKTEQEESTNILLQTVVEEQSTNILTYQATVDEEEEEYDVL